jgi:LmbE family N-acetylglucosaminyl deacetylase
LQFLNLLYFNNRIVMRHYCSAFFVFFICLQALGQNMALNGAQILHRLKKLQNTTRVLYLAAHPDDENTRVISWLENSQGTRTAYLSLTRGDGGQNLIGTELGAKLGVLRTQELMQARKIDGGEQFFTRAVDFGYSKTAEETFKQWNKKAVLADVVWVLRSFQPDIIITRFPADARGGHGHHTASAMLALEAFDLAAQKEAYSSQLQFVNTWQPKRLFWNHSTWWNQDLDSIAAADERYSVVDVGSYVPVLGKSCNEIASQSRTQHKSQGFGVSVDRGSRKEYLQLLKGKAVKQSIFDGIPEGWARYGWPEGDQMLKDIIAKLDLSKPYLIAEDLMALMPASEAITNGFQKNWFQKEIQNLFIAVTGLHLELLADSEYITKQSAAKLQLTYLNRSPLELSYFKGNNEIVEQPLKAESSEANRDLVTLFGSKASLPYNTTVKRQVPISEVSPSVSQPYWLRNSYGALFEVNNQTLIGQPENSPALEIMVPIALKNQIIMLPVKGQFKYSDRVEGEIINPLMVVPNYTVNLNKENLIFVNNESQELSLDIKAFKSGAASFKAQAKGWKVSPATVNLNFETDNAVKTVTLRISPQGPKTQTAYLQLTDENDDKPGQSMAEINYAHIEKRVVFEDAQAKLVRVDLAKKGQNIGYIKGAGDEVAAAIEQMGYVVDFLEEEDLKNKDLTKYHAIVAGIRAYNTQEWLPNVKEQLMAYVKQGGTYLVQYNTASRDLLSQNIGPQPFKISRQRVTEENSEVRFALPKHPVLNTPNILTPKDFEGWVQERGLYFAGTWHSSYAAPIGWHDAQEPERLGGLLIGHYGQGAFIYTGISFFRELPAGVEGAYRLWANLLSYKP